MPEYALRLESLKDNAPRTRMGDTLPMAANGPLTARGGLRPDGGGSVSVVEGSMDVTVSPFLGWVDGAASTIQGGYPFVLDAAKTVTLDAGDVAADRVDTLVAEVQDTVFDNSGATLARVYAVKGGPGQGAPQLPASCEPLRDITVPAGASAGTGGLARSNEGADRRRYTAALGGILPVANQAERDALAAQPGQAVYRLDRDALELLTPSGWSSTLGRGPHARLNRVTDNILANDLTVSLVGYHEVVESDPPSFADLASNRLVAPENGLYLLTLQVTFEGNDNGLRRIGIQVAGDLVLSQETAGVNTGADGQSITLSAPWRLAAGDVIEGYHAQNSGGSLTLPGSASQAASTFLDAVKIAD